MENAKSLILETKDLRAGYDKQNVLNDVSIQVKRGEIVAVLGHNGTGKTTLLKTIFGTVPASAGQVLFEGMDVTNASYQKKMRSGFFFTPAERNVFAELSVEDNLELAGMSIKDKKLKIRKCQEMYELFPRLAERKKQRAGSMSGGEQRLLSLAIALATDPKLLLLDEPSLGLAPSTAQDLFAEVRRLAEINDLSVVIVEQSVAATLRIADRVYYMRTGKIILEESAEASRQREHYWDLF